MLVRYVRKNKIRSTGNKEMEEKRKNVCEYSPHCRELKKRKKKFVHPFSFLLAENSKEGGRSSCFMFGLEED